jgi:hypothetical protein
MQNANVSHDKTKMDRMVRRRNHPAFVAEGRYIEIELFVVWCNVDGKKKKVMKKQRRGKE